MRGDHPKDPKRRLVGENGVRRTRGKRGWAGSGEWGHSEQMPLVSAPHRECKREELKLHQARLRALSDSGVD